jgi:hypothetical protein
MTEGRVLKIKYVAVCIDTSGRGNKTLRRHEFDDVEDAIQKHIIESKKHSVETSYWDICVEYSV